MADISPTRRKTNTVLGVLILGGIAWGIWRSYDSPGRVRRACEAIVPGWTLIELRAHAEDRGLELLYSGQSPDAAFLFDWLTHDDFLCDIKLSSGKVEAAQYLAPYDD